MANCKFGVNKRTGKCLKGKRTRQCRKRGKLVACPKKRKSKRKQTSWQGVKIALPKGATKLTDSHKATIDDSVTQSQWNSAKGGKCRGIFFTANKFALRCNRNRGSATKQGGMSRAAKARFKAAGGKKKCLTGKGKFKSC